MKSLIVLIANPAAHRASNKKVATASYFLQSKGYRVEVIFTHRMGDAQHLARESLRRQPSLVIAAGGDGTFNEVANGLVHSGIPMGILPLGTTNVLAKELDIPENIQAAMERVLRRNPKTVALGKITLTDSPSVISRYFILMAGVGYDATAIYGTNAALKQLSGQGAYIYSGVKTLLKFHPALLTITADGKHFEGYSCIIGNGAKYGGVFSVTPDATLSDPVLHVCIFKGRKRVDITRYVFGVVTGTHLKYRDVEYLRAENITISGCAHVQLDGDYFGMTPARFEVVRDALSLIF